MVVGLLGVLEVERARWLQVVVRMFGLVWKVVWMQWLQVVARGFELVQKGLQRMMKEGQMMTREAGLV